MSLRSSVEEVFGKLEELPTSYYSAVDEEVLWSEDKLTPEGLIYRLAFSFGEDEEGSYYLMDFWWDSPRTKSMTGIEVRLNDRKPQHSTVYTDEGDARLLQEKIQTSVLPKLDKSIPQISD